MEAAYKTPSTEKVPGLVEVPKTGTISTMEEAVLHALGWHPAIDEVTGRINQSDERIKAAEAGYYPAIKAGINSGDGNVDSDGWSPEFSVSASQLLYDFGKVASAVDAERAGKKNNGARLLLTIDNLARDTASAVVEVARYRELSNLSQSQIEGVKAITALVNERTDRGASTMSDKVQADARLEAAVATNWQNQSEYNRWQVALASLLGSERAPLISNVPSWLAKSCDVAEPDWSSVPAILEAEARKDEASALVEASRAEGLPTISLEASAGYDLNSAWSNRSRNDGQPEYFVGVNVTSSLYQGGLTNARKRAASHALQSAEAAVRTARFDIGRSLMEARSQIDTLNRLTASLESRADMMVKTRDLYRKQYLELGTRTLLDLLNAEQELHQSRFQMANTRHDLRRLHISCLYNSGEMRESFHIDPSMLRGGAINQ